MADTGSNNSVGVLDDDDEITPIVITVDSPTAGESEGKITFTISKNARTPVAVPVQVTTVGIEATPDVDYVDQSVTVLLPRRKKVSETVTFELIDDAIAEGTETFAVELKVPAWVRVEGDGGIGTILDDDQAGIAVDIGDGVFVAEGEAPDTVTVQLLSPPQAAVVVGIEADANQLDIDPASLLFDAGNWSQPQTISIAALADGVVEDDPHVVEVAFSVSSSDPFYDQMSVDPIEVTIEDDDAPAVTITGPTAGVPGQSATFAVTTTGGSTAFDWEAFMNGNSVATGSEDVFTFTPTDSGNYVVRVVATDSSGQSLSNFVDFTVLGDVADSPFAGDIIWLAEEGITKGCNPPLNDMFCPDGKLTRGQMAAFLVRFFGLTDPGGDDAFIDDDDSIFERDINILAAAGITSGCNPPESTLYCPDALIDRGQMAAFFVRALGLTDDGGGNLFIDDDVWIFEADIDKLATAGITKGCNPPVNDRYCPGDHVTRGQMAAFLHRASTLPSP